MGKRLRTAYNVYAWIWNHLWGTLFIAAGVYGLFKLDDVPIYFPPLAIAVGIYFYWTKSWSRVAEKTANKIYERSANAQTGASSDATVRSQGNPPTRTPPPPASEAEKDPLVAKRITAARIAGIAVVGIAFLWSEFGSPPEALFLAMLGIGLIGLAIPGYIVRLIPKGERSPLSPGNSPSIGRDPGDPGLVVASALAEEVAPGPVAEPPPEDFDAPEGTAPMEPRGPLSSKNLARGLVVVGAVVMLLVVGTAVVSGISRAVDGASAAGQRVEAEDVIEPDADGAPSADTDPISPDYHARMESDLFGSAPADGSMEFADVIYAGGMIDSMLSLEFYLVSRDPAEWYQIVVPDDVGYYIDYEPVSGEDSIMALDHTSDAYRARGMAVFNDTAVYELHVFTQGQKASASTPEKDQVTVVPDYQTLDLPYGEWESLEPAEWFEAHDAAVEAAFREAGLVAEITWTSFESEDDEAFQEPPAGSAVPVGTTVYITIYTLE